MTMHRTAQGRNIDMASLAKKHEKVRAVGNMNVNARGDTLNAHNQIIQDQSQRVNTAYKTTMENRAPLRRPAGNTNRMNVPATRQQVNPETTAISQKLDQELAGEVLTKTAETDEWDEGFDEAEVAKSKTQNTKSNKTSKKA